MNSDNRKPFGGWGPLQGGNEEAAPSPHQQDKWEVILGLLWVNIASEWGGGGVGPPRWLPHLFGALPYKAVQAEGHGG